MSIRSSAARYGKALFDVATAESTPEDVERDLVAFAEVVKGHAELQRTLVNPAVPLTGKRAIVQQVLDRLQPAAPVRKLLLLLAERDRLELLPDLVDVFQERVLEHRKVVKAEVTTAAPLSADRLAHLQQRLTAATGRKVDVTTKVDPSLIGGMVTRIGTTVYDGSVATQLAALRQRLTESAFAAPQSGRDRS
jgi:F-type H+-transporting ATPase subunit delta